jgi:hypothetical protein
MEIGLYMLYSYSPELKAAALAKGGVNVYLQAAIDVLEGYRG